MKTPNNVMIIDDEPFMNLINEKIIEKAHFASHVNSYSYAGQALDELKVIASENGEFPEYIFIDINMPEMDGWAFLDELKKFPETILRKCKICLLSASVHPGDIEKSKPYTMVRDFIAKPLSVSKLHSLFSSTPTAA